MPQFPLWHCRRGGRERKEPLRAGDRQPPCGPCPHPGTRVTLRLHQARGQRVPQLPEHPGRDRPPQRPPRPRPGPGRAEVPRPSTAGTDPAGSALGQGHAWLSRTTGTGLPPGTPSCGATPRPRHPPPREGPCPPSPVVPPHRSRARPVSPPAREAAAPGRPQPISSRRKQGPQWGPAAQPGPAGTPPAAGKGTRLWPRGLRPFPGHHPAPRVVARSRLGTLRLAEMTAPTPHHLQLHQPPSPQPPVPTLTPPAPRRAVGWGVYKYFIAAVLGAGGCGGAAGGVSW